MKKLFQISILVFASMQMNAQQHFAGTTTTSSDIFRSGNTALGYTTLPSFGSNQKLLVNGITRLDNTTSIFQPRLLLAPNILLPNSSYWIQTEGGILVQPNSQMPLGANIMVRGIVPYVGGSFASMSVAAGDYHHSNISKKGDIILRAHAWGNVSKNFIINNDGTGHILFTTKELPSQNGGMDQIRMSILNNGNIGIGTETPTELLAVNGTIHAKEVRVDLVGWPDYVFEKDYKLKTIEEVETHIKEKGHLPNVPSATEIETNGLKLAEMSKLQMEKIEELTLYIIELKKTIEKQESRLQALENKN